MKAALVLVALLAGVALTQAGPVAAAAAAPERPLQEASDVLALAAPVKDLVTKARCLAKVAVEVVLFIADIPRNCVDISLRALGTQGLLEALYVLPACLVYSLVGAEQLATLSGGRCLDEAHAALMLS